MRSASWSIVWWPWRLWWHAAWRARRWESWSGTFFKNLSHRRGNVRFGLQNTSLYQRGQRWAQLAMNLQCIYIFFKMSSTLYARMVEWKEAVSARKPKAFLAGFMHMTEDIKVIGKPPSNAAKSTYSAIDRAQETSTFARKTILPQYTVVSIKRMNSKTLFSLITLMWSDAYRLFSRIETAKRRAFKKKRNKNMTWRAVSRYQYRYWKNKGFKMDVEVFWIFSTRC